VDSGFDENASESLSICVNAVLCAILNRNRSINISYELDILGCECGLECTNVCDLAGIKLEVLGLIP